jgi:hypothetical protein
MKENTKPGIPQSKSSLSWRYNGVRHSCQSQMSRKARNRVLLILVGFLLLIGNTIFAEDFDFSPWLFDYSSTLEVWLDYVGTPTDPGAVRVNGIDLGPPGPVDVEEFICDWGNPPDVDIHGLPFEYSYTDRSKNYIITVTTKYTDGSYSIPRQLLVEFVTPSVTPIPLPSGFEVTIPDGSTPTPVPFATRNPPNYEPPPYDYFDGSYLDESTRSIVEYILTVCAHIQMDLVNDDVFLIDGDFKQRIVKSTDPDFNGMGCLWFTDPVGIISGDYGFQGDIEWSSFIHEMGHNFTLNTPSHCFYGGKIDGRANTIYSETMAQIFAHTTAYILLNNYASYGIDAAHAYGIRQSAISSMQFVRDKYQDYIDYGPPDYNFCTWDTIPPDPTPTPPGSDPDETLETFMTIAYKFFEHAETSGLGYQIPLKRMMELLQVFDQDMADAYQGLGCENDPAADAFMATLMVTAMSHGFSMDLREEFRNLGFLISDSIYYSLLKKIPYTVLNSEGFESPFYGSWVNVFGDDANWVRYFGNTPTSNTGPSSGANGSTWYRYFGSAFFYSPGEGDTAILKGPLIGGDNRTLSFYYHMYGSDMGTLNVDVSTGRNWINIWSISGQQHSSSSEPYTQAVVDLREYSGPVQLRFRGVAIGGTHCDVAIDDIEIINN